MYTNFTQSVSLPGLNGTLDDVTTSLISERTECDQANDFIFYYRLQSAGSPGPLQLVVEFQHTSGGEWFQFAQDGFLNLKYLASGLSGSGQRLCLTGPVAAPLIRIRAIASGLTDVDTYTISEAAISLKGE